jgi:glucose-6-phosphate 1-dehydrogenase
LTSINESSCILVLFGAHGDLTFRKLMPAIYNLHSERLLPERFAVVTIGRRDHTDEEYRREVFASIGKYSRNEPGENIWAALKERVFYRKFDFHDGEGYSQLQLFLNELDEKYDTRGNRMYYLAVAPEYFETITTRLHDQGMAKNDAAWQRVMIEKPFGRNLKSAKALNETISSVFSESNIYRIDHYLGKEMLQNIMVMRFANSLFEPLWNRNFIDNIQISSSETVGVENRGNYYEKAGIMRDMLQNHMLQLLCLTAMEPPSSLHANAIRSEKVKILSSLQRFGEERVMKDTVFGQYGPGRIHGQEVPGYRQEEKVAPQSGTHTYGALKIMINTPRWRNVPFYIRTGKRMASKSTEVIVQFKPSSRSLYASSFGKLESNLLVIRIQPREGIYLQFNAKQPGTELNIIPVQMDFCQNCQIGSNSAEAYERLLYDAIRGDSTLFTRWDEVEYSWRFIDDIMEVVENREFTFPNYAAGTWGPPEADELLAGDGKRWWNL